MTRKLCIMAFAGLLIGSLILASKFLVKISDEKFRYGLYCPLYYAVEKNADEPVFVAFSGSSRFLRAIDANLFEEIFAKKTNQEVNALDMSRSHRGMGMTYFTFRRLLEKRQVKHLVIEYNQTTRSNPVHQQLAKVATFGEILSDMRTYPTLFHSLEFGLRNFKRKISDGIYWRLKNRSCSIPPEKYKKTLEMTASITSVPEHLMKRREVVSTLKSVGRELEIELNSRYEARQKIYIQKILDLAKTKNTKVHFVYTPRYFGPLPSERSTKEFESEFGLDLHIPDDSTVKALANREGYLDPTHMHISGSDIYLNWLIESVFLRNGG